MLSSFLILGIVKADFIMERRIVLTASVFGLLAVILGAFGAHGLKSVVSSSAIEVWSKGVEYQFYHALALLFLSRMTTAKPRLIQLSYLFFTLGVICFSGSLYLLSTREVTNISFAGILGPVTPIGGLFFILGWVMLFLSALKNK